MAVHGVKKIIVITDGSPSPLVFALIEKTAAFVLGLSRRQSANRIGVSLAAIKNLRYMGTAKIDRQKQIKETFADLIELRIESDEICE